MKLISIALAGALFCGPALAQNAPAGDAEKGQKLFMADACWQCHNVGGTGAAATGPRLARTALTYDAFLHQLRHPAAEMAPFEAAVLPDSGAADIYAYLKSLPELPQAKDLPLLMGMGVK